MERSEIFELGDFSHEAKIFIVSQFTIPFGIDG
jgi:hypothetical protein